ncbi:MAG: tyrosine-protein phosphatase [Firmicutes bacterium]|nr:tyrosine-protein phosphatase [Bacillota bacterium]
MQDRSIAFEKIANARDMGGLHTVEGRVLSPGLLIRSANLSEATQADRIVLRDKYHLSIIIDLRTETERTQMPDASVAAADYLPIFFHKPY